MANTASRNALWSRDFEQESKALNDFKRCGGANALTQVPIVVAVNASPLIGLAKGRRLPLLRLLYDEVLIPSLVYDDVVVKGHRRAGRGSAQRCHRGLVAGSAVSDASLVPLNLKAQERRVIALARMKKQAT
jgi:predicted nucleic acid-binding protein